MENRKGKGNEIFMENVQSTCEKKVTLFKIRTLQTTGTQKRILTAFPAAICRTVTGLYPFLHQTKSILTQILLIT